MPYDRIGELNNIGTVNMLLTKLVRGYKNKTLIGNELFPNIEVEKMNGNIPMWNKEAFRIYKTERALRGPANRISSEWFTTEPYKLNPYALETVYDSLEIEQSKEVNLEMRAATRLKNNMLLSIEKAQADLIQNLNTYPTDNKETMSDNFLNEASIDPIIEIRKRINKLSNIIGVKPNYMVLGDKVWQSLEDHPKIKSYFTVNLDMSNTIVDTEMLRKKLGLDKILVGGALTVDSDDNFLPIWGNNIFLGYVVPPQGDLNKTEEEPFFGYTLKLRNAEEFLKYTEQGGDLIVSRVKDIYTIKVVGAESGYLINQPIDPTVYDATGEE